MHREKGRGPGKKEAENGVMRPRPREALQPPEAGRGERWVLPLSPRREPGPATTLVLDFWFPKP